MSLTNNVKPLPSIFVYKEVVNERVHNFRNNKLPLLSDAIGKPDTQSGWYSLQQFEELMREMYYLHADGVRFYFGAHSSNDPLYPDQLTFVLVPTYWDASTECHKDIVVEEMPDFETRNAIETSAAKHSEDVKNYDTISLCPPRCPNNMFSYPY
jgi:hypothetical protein